jgi:hypothetical protein
MSFKWVSLAMGKLDKKLCLVLWFTGEQIPITPSSRKSPIPNSLHNKSYKLKANFGDNPAKPFKYDIKKCPRLMFE